MPQNYDRTDRISEEVKREVAHIIKNELKDPRLAEMISITRVEVTRDFSQAKIYVSILGDEQQRKDSMKALQSASGYVRRELKRNLGLHHTPEPLWVLDTSIEYGVHIAEVIKSVAPEGVKHDSCDD